jgi:hypothetical protein
VCQEIGIFLEQNTQKWFQKRAHNSGKIGRNLKLAKKNFFQAELAAAFNESSVAFSPMTIDVNLANGRSIAVPVEAQTTAAELCANLASQIGLKDSFGFGLFLSTGKIVRALGAGSEKLVKKIEGY